MPPRISSAAPTSSSTRPSGPAAIGSRSRSCTIEGTRAAHRVAAGAGSRDLGGSDLRRPARLVGGRLLRLRRALAELVVLPARPLPRVPVELVVERLLADPERLRRARLVVLQAREAVQDVLLLHLAQGQPEWQLEVGALAAARRQ